MINQAEDHPEQFPRAQGEVLRINHVDEDGEHLELEINVHPADNLYFGLVDAMRRCKGLPKIPFRKRTFGPSMHEEEGKDFHASGYGLRCDAVANKGATQSTGQFSRRRYLYSFSPISGQGYIVWCYYS